MLYLWWIERTANYYKRKRGKSINVKNHKAGKEMCCCNAREEKGLNVV
jgi:hypothetical protein